MIIGIKYCGGCRIEYDRKKIIEELMDDYSSICIKEASEDESYDILMVVNGCRTACAEHGKYSSMEKIFINSKQYYSKIKNRIIQFEDICKEE